jgi:hypothetical protein
LTVASGETNSSLTVKATSAEDARISGTATVQIPTVTGVTVTPSTADVAKGGSTTFIADVAASGGAGTGVTWSVVTTSVSANTKFPNPTTSGLFQVASDETVTSITIRATSTVDESKSGTATVTVTQPTVSGVELSPSVAVFVAPGGTRQFSATVKGTNSPSQTVTWTLVGNSHTSTTISSTGSLTVASGETAAIFKVRASSTENTSVYGETTVSTKSARFVAVAVESATAAFSHDGGTWTAATLPVSADWANVTYGNGRFVAVAEDSSNAAYSADGITWTAAATPPGNAGWRGLTYGNGKFVAIAWNSNKTAYSTDGNTWTTTTNLPVRAYWWRVVYGGSKFVAITGSGQTGEATAYSTDGINWTAGGNLPSKTKWMGLTYGNGKFVAVSDADDNRAAYSTDGINWTAAATPPNSSASWYSVAYGNGKFVAVASYTYRTAYSTDGSAWTEGPDMPVSADWYRVVYGDGKFVAGVASDANTKAAYLTDSGTSWQAATMPRAYWFDLAVRTD